MKKLLLFILLFTMTKVYAQKPVVSIIPQPVEIQQSEGIFTLNKTSTIGFDSQESRKIAEMFSQKLKQATGFSINPQHEKAGSIQFNLNKVAVPQIG